MLVNYRSFSIWMVSCLTAGVIAIWCHVAGAQTNEVAAVARGWSIETVATAHANYLDLEIDSRGMLHLVFHNDGNGDNFYLRRESPGVWADWAFPYAGSGLLLDIDPVDEKPYVLYSDHSSFDLMLAWKTAAGVWTNTVVLVTDYLPELAFEMSDGIAHISYVTALNEVAYYRFDPNGPSWGASFGTAAGMERPEVSLALRSDGVPRVSYDLDGVLYYATTADTLSWTSTVVDDSSANLGQYNSLALDSSDNPSIGYSDSANNDLKYAFYNSLLPGWAPSVVDGARSELISMALDPRSDYPAIAYRTFDCAVCLNELVGSGQWARTEVTDGITYQRKIVVNEVGDVFIAYHAESAAGVNEIKVAIDGRRIFHDDFELGTLAPWSAVVGAP
jgi:hypothetical protein